MSVIEITNREYLQVGDVATFTYRDRDHVEHEFTGPLWSLEKGTLLIGRTRVYDPHGGWSPGLDFVRATRPAPALPTEMGAVILVSECRGERLDPPVLAVCDGEDEWRTFSHEIDGCMWHRPEHITAWTPAKVVPA